VLGASAKSIPGVPTATSSSFKVFNTCKSCHVKSTVFTGSETYSEKRCEPVEIIETAFSKRKRVKDTKEKVVVISGVEYKVMTSRHGKKYTIRKRVSTPTVYKPDLCVYDESNRLIAMVYVYRFGESHPVTTRVPVFTVRKISMHSDTYFPYRCTSCVYKERLVPRINTWKSNVVFTRKCSKCASVLGEVPCADSGEVVCMRPGCYTVGIPRVSNRITMKQTMHYHHGYSGYVCTKHAVCVCKYFVTGGSDTCKTCGMTR
jgi:hypothetical protein